MVLFSDSEVKPLPAMRFRNLRIEYSSQYRLEIDGDLVTRSFTLLKLITPDSHLRNSFSKVVSAAIEVLPAHPTTSDVRSQVANIIELFAEAPKVSQAVLVGLFGELAFIRYAPNPDAAANAWHSSPLEKSDFNFATKSIEVKTTTSDIRVHSIREHQLHQPEKPIYVCSVRLTPDAAGKNLVEFFTETLTHLSHISQQNVINVFFKTIGLEYDDILDLKFSVLGGDSDILLFQATDLPRPTSPDGKFGTAISKIAFELNFTVLRELNVPFTQLSSFSDN
jgi:hypothetical protein